MDKEKVEDVEASYLTQGNENEDKNEKKDNMMVAVIAMNIAVFSATGMGASYKVIAAEGFHPAELNLMRNTLSFLVSLIWCCVTRVNPLNEFPHDKKLSLFVRMAAG